MHDITNNLAHKHHMQEHETLLCLQALFWRVVDLADTEEHCWQNIYSHRSWSQEVAVQALSGSASLTLDHDFLYTYSTGVYTMWSVIQYTYG